MELEYSQERRLLKESVERFVKERYGFAQRKPILESAGRFSAQAWAAFAEFGWLGLPLPQEHGGFDGGALDVGIVLEGFGRGLVLEPYVSTVVIGAGLVNAAGTDVQRQRWLPAIAAGQARVALADTESLHLTLDPVLATRARKTNDGWLLTGTKRLVLDGPGAHWLAVSALVDGAAALFMVPGDAEGLIATPYETLDGRLACDLVLDGVRVADDLRLAGAGDAGAVLREVADRAVIATCSEAVGCMQVLLDDTVAYTKTRVQFERPIATNQVLRHRMVDMGIACEEARAMAWRAALHADAEPPVRMREASAARVKISRAARLVAEGAVQLHGAMGVTEELNVGAYLKRLMAIERSFGTAAEHHERVAALRAASAAN